MKLKNILASAVIAVASAALVAVPVSAASVTCPSNSLRKTAASIALCNVPEEDEGDSLMKTVVVIIKAILGVLGLVSVVVIVLGGVKYTTSTGDPGKVKSAKDTILYGVVGLVIALLAFGIVNFVLGSIGSGPAQSSDSTVVDD
jgi:hypothetical protein